MARVDFYILEQADGQARLRLACRLAEKAWLQAQKVLMLAAGTDDARALDEMLWTFRDRSFVPHEIYAPSQAPRSTVLISDGTALPAEADVLINLCDRVPEGFERFPRIVEPVDGDPARRQAGRERYRFYRERGMAPESHTVQHHNEL
ncbi:MAG TPA: DNA polymerase III subunit chi [Steroidobacteraceae bacterium]|nr:DNA polymerase III subunit chi [Steroidobacteraceae bacterium]